MDSTSTIGGFMRTLTEMGFSEDQIQAAIQAGFFNVSEAAEWLLQGGSPRHKLLRQHSGPKETAFSAFNPPIDAHCSSHPQPVAAGPSLVLEPPLVNAPTANEPPPLETRIKQDKSHFREQQRQRVAQEARAERKQKKQERELVLKRIAEDRHRQQTKSQSEPSSESCSSSTQGGQRLGGRVETSAENQCILMIRLPSGESMRERFPADTPLSQVVEYITNRHPSLPTFTLLQGFPRKRFGEAELACSLQSLGLTPNAALCIQTTPPETPQDPPSPASRMAVEAEAELDPVEPPGGALEEPLVPPPLANQLWEEAVGYAGIPGVEPPLSGPSHYWGRGHKLAPGDAENERRLENEEQPEVPPPYFPGGTERTQRSGSE